MSSERGVGGVKENEELLKKQRKEGGHGNWRKLPGLLFPLHLSFLG